LLRWPVFDMGCWLLPMKHEAMEQWAADFPRAEQWTPEQLASLVTPCVTNDPKDRSALSSILPELCQRVRASDLMGDIP
jgi:hypothetical protein